jgi:type I restriction enzyme, S subunit
MNAGLLLKHFAKIIEAPEAVPLLRRFILDLAVRGKLVQQDEKEISSSDLQVVKLEDLNPEFQNGVSSRGDPNGVPTIVLRLADIENTRVTLTETRTLSIESKSVSKYLLEEGDILIVRVNGSADIVGKFVLIDQKLDAIYCDHFIRMRLPRNKIHPEFLELVGASPALREQIQSLFVTTSGQKTVNQKHIGSLKFPLPPLEEQRRIVAKVSELMMLCDTLENATKTRETLQDQLSASSLHFINQEKVSPEETQLILAQLPRMTARKTHVKALRQTILNLAVRGKLVPQNETDEPAEKLLERIKLEKEKLVKAGRIHAQLAILQAVKTKSASPPGWIWVRFGEVMFSRDSERIPVSKEERTMRKKSYDYYGASGVIDKIDSFIFDKPLLLIGEDGANLINRSTPIAFIARGKYWVNNHAHVLDGISEEFLKFIELQINATDLRPYVTGTAQPKMNQANMNSIPIALPPLEEQHRIVTKVSELMTLCDTLETELYNQELGQQQLLEAVLHHALTPSLD